MSLQYHQRDEQPAIRTDLGAIFVSLELSRSKWLVTSLSPGAGEKMSKHSVVAGDIASLFEYFAEFKRKAAARMERAFPIIAIQEAGLDGFWIHRVLEREGIESHVVDAASILVSRHRRRGSWQSSNPTYAADNAHYAKSARPGVFIEIPPIPEP